MKGLLFITHQTDKYDYLQSIEIALSGGCRQIQLRMKDSPIEDILKVGIEAKKMCSNYNASLYIDDHVEICKQLRLNGVHLGKSDMSPSKARKILGDNFIIGGTANTFEDIQRLKKEGVNYIGLGPFKFTNTKKNLSPILGLSGYQTIVKQCKEHTIHLPIIAIGGITIEDIPSLMNVGVSGTALSSTILNSENPVEETKRIINLINQYTS